MSVANRIQRARDSVNWLLREARIQQDPDLASLELKYQVALTEAICAALVSNQYGIWEIREMLVEDCCTIEVNGGLEKQPIMTAACQRVGLAWPFSRLTALVHIRPNKVSLTTNRRNWTYYPTS